MTAAYLTNLYTLAKYHLESVGAEGDAMACLVLPVVPECPRAPYRCATSPVSWQGSESAGDITSHIPRTSRGATGRLDMIRALLLVGGALSFLDLERVRERVSA